MANNATEVKIADIEQRKELMPRSGISEQVVSDYRESLEFLPPIRVAEDTDKHLVLIDGWHRIAAFTAEGRKTIPAIIDKTLKSQDFFFEAAKSNKAHGRRLTADEKRAVCRRLFVEENRDVPAISDATGISERHVRRLVEAFNEVKKEMAQKKASVLAKQKNPNTGKKYTTREIADELNAQGFEASKSSVNRWLQSARAEAPTAKAKSKSGQGPEQDTEPGIEAEGVGEESAQKVALPKTDAQPADEFIGRLNNMLADVDTYIKKAKSLSFSYKTLDKVAAAAELLEKKLHDLGNTCIDLQLNAAE